jgi:O-antigen/teichoic acid export membrane protein
MKLPFAALAADQAASSLITFTLSVYAARNASVSEFGVFAVGYALTWVLMGLSRSILGELHLILGKDRLETVERWRSFSAASSIGVGLVSGVVLFVACTALASASGSWIPWSFGVAIPMVIFADSLRYVAFTDNAPADALTLDIAWLLGALIAPPALAAIGVPPVPSAILGWAFGAGLGATISLARRPLLRPVLSGAAAWAAERRVTAAQYAIDFLVGNGIGQVATALIPLVSSLAVAGGLRAGLVILGPLNVVSSAMIVFLIPRIRDALHSGHALPSPALKVWSAFAAYCAFCAVIVLLLPDRIGEFLLGPSWSAGQSIAPILAAAFAFSALQVIIVQVMRLRGSAGLVIPVRLFVSGVQTTPLLLGAAFFGLKGAAAGSALAALAAVLPWWLALKYSRESFKADGS